MEKREVKTTKYLTFNYVVNPPPSTSGLAGEHNYFVENKKGEILGWVNLYKPWNKYVFTPNGMVILDVLCLQAIVSFIESLKE